MVRFMFFFFIQTFGSQSILPKVALDSHLIGNNVMQGSLVMSDLLFRSLRQDQQQGDVISLIFGFVNYIIEVLYVEV